MYMLDDTNFVDIVQAWDHSYFSQSTPSKCPQQNGMISSPKPSW